MRRIINFSNYLNFPSEFVTEYPDYYSKVYKGYEIAVTDADFMINSEEFLRLKRWGNGRIVGESDRMLRKLVPKGKEMV